MNLTILLSILEKRIDARDGGFEPMQHEVIPQHFAPTSDTIEQTKPITFIFLFV